MHNEKYVMIGGQRGQGKIFALEQKIAKQEEELKQLRRDLAKAHDEKHFLARELMRIEQSDNPAEIHEKIIRISYRNLQDSETAMKILVMEMERFIKSFGRKQ